jgi:hypothetical protein
VSPVTLRAIGARTGWGSDVAAFPARARATPPGAVIAVEPAPRAGDRLRRATRECRLAIDAVEALLDDGGLARADIAGPDTALVYVTAAAYGASNRAFVEGGGHALHFPYTAPSAVPAEVSIEFALHGPYAVLIGGAAATIDAIQHAAVLLARGACARAIVLAVETFAESAGIVRRGGAVDDGPLVEAAAAGLFEREVGGPGRAPQPHAPRPGEAAPLRGCRFEETSLACGPLLELAARRDEPMIELRGTWRGREAVITVGGASENPARPVRKEC